MFNSTDAIYDFHLGDQEIFETMQSFIIQTNMTWQFIQSGTLLMTFKVKNTQITQTGAINYVRRRGH